VRAGQRTLLLEIRLDGYEKMREEMIKFGHKMAFHEMENVIRRNFITKNWLRRSDKF
jgi:hypothetical protein